MIRKTLVGLSLVGTTALAAALSGPGYASAQPAATPEAAPKLAAAAYPPSSTVITKVKKHGVWTTSFKMVRSTASITANCLPKAKAKVAITHKGEVDVMKVHATGLPKKTDFDFFVIQVPDAPFGLSWYQGDLDSDKHGKADVTYIGRFNKETFTVAPGVAKAPVLHTSPIADAATNPVTAPVHQFHLGFWFNDPADATKAGCLGAVTPFNGDHDAGVQAMSTAQFGPLDGPLRHVRS